jgi:Cu/Ag efflux protein CusF
MKNTLTRRTTLIAAAAALASMAWSVQANSPKKMPVMQVWKDPNCGCCNDWVAILRKEGFDIQTFDTGNTAMRQRLGLPTKFGSCHTALIDGYVIEGHVNPSDIKRLLAERPQALGLAVPGMPVGSPGMDGPEYGNRRDPYDVLLVQKDGSSRVYQSYFRQASTTVRDGFERVQHSGQEATTSTPNAAVAALPWAQAEVRRVDVAAGKISLKHGEIKNLDMPPMSMVFQVQDKALLSQIKVGDKVRFTADQIKGAYTVLSIEAMP